AAEGLRVFIDRPEACGGLKTRLDEVKLKPHQRGGEVSVIIMGSTREVELRLPDKYGVNPRIAGAIKAVPGVVHVEEL
ncbi:MAG: hypothetical protein VW950_07675, partial [Rhodobiaceae bacterium]